ncbi:MAG: TonB-dependent receptor plug domain-containing protein [Paludibacter sp.]
MKNTINISIICCFLFVFNPINATNIPIEKIDSIGLNEIVVQASRDNSKLKTIPNSVSIISSKQIESLGINSLADVTSTVANLFMPDYGSKLTSPIYIRGVGSRINAPSVGLYVDRVPYFEKAAFNFDFFDVNRIEVLRGPQGTQYGRNTMGGIVNILTKSPLNYQGTDLKMQAGTYGSYLLNVGHYAQPNDQLAWSLALNYRHNDGFFTNDFLNKQVDKLDSYGLRNRLIWTINERFSVENILSFENSNQGGYPYAVYNDTLSKSKIAYNQQSSYKRNLLSDALAMKYHAQDFDLTSTTSYQYLSDKQSIDQDFTVDSLYFVIQNQKQNMVSEEIIIQSKNQKKYSWMFGAYGFMQQFDNFTDVNTYKKKTETMKYYDHSISGAALFHQSTIKNFPVKNMNLTAGIRVDAETDQLGYRFDRIVNGVLAHLADTTYKSLNSLQIQPKLAVNYTFSNTNLYALVARGYKTGGFNSTFERPEDLTFEPEYSWNYEIGAKSSLLNNFLYAECSLFYIDWKNQQIYQTVPSGTGSMLKNAGRSVSKGLELSLNTATIYGFDFIASYGYTQATFLSNVLNATTDYSGNYIPYVPKHTVAGQVKKSIEIRNSQWLDRIILHVLYKGMGGIYWDDKNSHKQDFYSLLDARVSFVRKNMQFDIWGTNLTSATYESFYFETSGKKYIQIGKPLQVGLKLSVNF